MRSPMNFAVTTHYNPPIGTYVLFPAHTVRKAR